MATEREKKEQDSKIEELNELLNINKNSFERKLTEVEDELKKREDERILLRRIPQGAGSKLDADTLRNKIPEDFAKKNGDTANDFSIKDVTFTNATQAGYIEGAEIADPSAPASNKGRLYFRDNGAGKTQLVCRFPTGAIQVIATEP